MPLRAYNDYLTGRERYAYLLLAIGLGILLIACINFTNLATARSMLRAREIGMRKVLGASRGRLIGQFLGEALVTSFLALFAGCAAAELLLPAFNDFVGLELSLDLVKRPERLAALVGLGLATGLLAGSYPALYLSGFAPLATIQAGTRAKAGGRGLRHGLVVVQFALSMILLVGIGVMYRQIQYMKAHDLRFERENVLVLPVSTRDFADREGAVDRIGAFQEQLAGLSGVASVAASDAVPSRYGGNFMLMLPEGQEDRSPLDWRYTRVDDRFFDTYGIRFVEGRNFSRDFGTDADEGVIVNEAALRVIGWNEGVGRKLKTPSGRQTLTILGVVEDFHYAGVNTPIQPVLHFFGGERNEDYRFLSVRLRQNAAGAALAQIRAAWRAFDPSREPDFFFVDEAYNGLYETEENTARIVTYAALLAVLIACLGLLGLASFTVVQRTKEIGVRKVLGAGVPSIVSLFARQFARPVLLAVVLAAPVAYFLMDRWLADFPYRVALSGQLGIFVLAGAGALAVALLTVSAQTLKAALANPVKALRYE
jgi:putative ABC transport system permease protein